MKRILGIAVVLGLVGALTVMAQEVKTGKVDVIDIGEGVNLEMVLIPAGKFKMGFTKKEIEEIKDVFLEDMKKIPSIKDAKEKERLDVLDFMWAAFTSHQGGQHEVTIAKPFYIGKYEVTQEQWQAVMVKNPSAIKGAKLPVTNVSLEDCQDYIKKLNAKTDGGYRLPTECEWEYACRAGTMTAYSFGAKITPKDANYDEFTSLEKPAKPVVAVGSYKANAYGLYDMHGNVMEWCEGWHKEYSYIFRDTRLGIVEHKGSVGRGGSCRFTKYEAMSSYRQAEILPTLQMEDNGFRLAKDK